MSTRLSKSIVRRLQYGTGFYKVVVSPEGIRVTPKGSRRGVDVSWDDILAFEESRVEPSAVVELSAVDSMSVRNRKPNLGMQDVVAADLLLLIQHMTDALVEASSLINGASELPAILAKHREPHRPREEERSDWYIEPLLTIRQVSKLLGVSTRRVRNLSIKAISLDGEVRYQPAELRRFLAMQSTTPRPIYRR